MLVPLTDLKAQYNSIKEEVDAAMQRIVEQGRFILGPEVEAFEREMASYCSTKFAIGVASGTDALYLALVACGVSPGDEVITTPFTFIATAEAIMRCDAIPVFVDIDPQTYNMDAAKIEPKITPKTRAIIPVHLYGAPTDMEAILELGKRYGLRVIEDCAQALGAMYRDKKVGSMGDAGCLSFFPAKNLGAYGDGGMVITNNQQIAEVVSMLRQHGSKANYYHLLHGLNSRLDTLQAAILRVKLKYLDEWIKQRRQKAGIYSQLLSKIKTIKPPYSADYSYHAFNYYTVRLTSRVVNREKLLQFLSSNGIANAIYYPLSLHLQEVYRALNYKKGDCPESESAQEEVFSLPLYPELEEDKIEEVVMLIKSFIQEKSVRK